MPSPFYSIAEARLLARRRMPRIMFDYIDGAAGSEYACGQNIAQLDRLRMLPRVLVNSENRTLAKHLLGRRWALPFGIAPMGMCDLTWPGTDEMLATAARRHGIPIGLSTMASSSIEETRERAGECAWFQLYVGQSEQAAMDLLDRCEASGYETLLFTVDVPVVAARPREQRNGFQAPLKIGPKQFLDFASHPRWSLTTLYHGAPKVANNNRASGKFVRSESRAWVDWDFFARLRKRWHGPLIVKGVLAAADAVRLREAGADGVYISNHGGRQLDSAPSSVQVLTQIRHAVGADFPLLFDSGVRNGEAILKALALGADFVMLGRPFLYAAGAAGHRGVETLIELLRRELDTALAQLGHTDIEQLDAGILFKESETPTGHMNF